MTFFLNNSVNVIKNLWFILITIIFIFGGLFPIKLFAQETISKTTLHKNPVLSTHVLFLEYSYSPTSYILLGKTPYSSSQRAGIGFISPYSLLIFGTNFNLSVRLHPIISYTYSKRDEGGRLDNVHGWSLDPLGLSSTTHFNKSVKLRNTIYGGLSYMSDIFPTDKGRKLNFNFELQTTIEQALGKNYIVCFGAAYHHISNAQTGKQNPGIDSIYLLLRLSYLTD
ncbi:MAG: hypothetical protein CL669_04960 [Balneola sp.]|nr:hypothetical protein [Balneola sp.]